MIGIIGAMQEEVNQLIDKMTDISVQTKAGMEFHAGRIDKAEVVIVQSGIGKVNAAACTQMLIDLYSVDYIINTGIAGSLDAKIDIGDIVISSDAVEHDMDASAFGYPLGQVPQMKVHTFPTDEKLAKMAQSVCESVNPDIKCYIGRVASGDIFVSSESVKVSIKVNFDALCTEMEGAAIAHVAYLNHIPCLIIRAISDKADGSATQDYPSFEAQAALHCSRLTLALIAGLN